MAKFSGLSEYNLTIYPLEDKFIASIEINEENIAKAKQNEVETIIILDRSGSMGNSVYKIVHSILPKFFEFLAYNIESQFHLITFESRTKYEKVKIGALRDLKMFSCGGTQMSPAVEKLQELFIEFDKNQVSALRILTISDGEVWDQKETENMGEKLAEFAAKMNISVNSQAVRFFTSRAQPDTTALCSLLQLNNMQKSKLIDVEATRHHDKIAKEMANLFVNDGFDDAKILTCNYPIFYKFPWDERGFDQLMIMPNRRNVFWLDQMPASDQILKINDKIVKVSVEHNLTIDMFQILINAKIDFIVDRMKIFKVIDTEFAKLTMEKIVEYFTRIENTMANLLPKEDLDARTIENRARIIKLNAIRSRKISILLATIANDDHVKNLNAAQKAEYLRSVQGSSKAGRGLAKRATKKSMKNISAPVFTFDEIARSEVKKMKENFGEIENIDCKNHQISFYSQATTLEGIRALISLVDDPLFTSFDANEILQFLNLVGVACSGPISDFPDASTWRANEIFVGCYVSVADIITSIQQSGKPNFVIKAPGIDKEITNVIPVFDDQRIGVFLKKYAPSLLEFTSSIGMRRVIADVPMTFSYTIVAGIRRLMYDLNKCKSTAHIEAFSQFVVTAAGFVGKYYDHIEELLTDKDCGKMGFYLANNGIGSMIVPLIRIFMKKQHEKLKNRLPDILRSIYSCEIWRGISKDFRSKTNFNKIAKEMLHKLLSIDLENSKMPVQEVFVPEPENLIFSDSYTVNKEYLDKLAQPLYYHNYMSLLPTLFNAVIKNEFEDIKKLPEMTKASAMEAFGIDYNHNEFIFLNVFQALRYPRSSSRIDTKDGQMKILDVKFKNYVIEDVKEYVRQEYRAHYEYEVKMKKRKEEKILADELVELMIKEESYEGLLELWKHGVSRNLVNYQLTNTSSLAFGLLLRKIMDVRLKIPLRSIIIKIMLLAVDNENRVVYNRGEVADVKNFRKFKKRFLLTNSIDEWNEIEMKMANRGNHLYRLTKLNRHGNGAENFSYWAMGYRSLIDYFEDITEKEINVYVSTHNNCSDVFSARNKVIYKRYEKEFKEMMNKNQAKEEDNDEKKCDT